jgi:hypothetical protein
MLRRSDELSFWILEDYGTDKWTLKYRVTKTILHSAKGMPQIRSVIDE